MRIFTRTLAVWGLLILTLPALAGSKEAPLTAIELFDSPGGPAYLQLTDLLINGRSEMRACPNCPAVIDKSIYNKLEKLTLSAGGTLERGEDGILRYSFNGGAALVVLPGQIKFEHNASFSASELADQASLSGTAQNGAAGPEALKKGVRLVLVAAPDEELAEFLLAQRRASVAGWQDYLAKYAAASHTGEAKATLAGIFTTAGLAALHTYEQSLSGATPDYDSLKNARAQAAQARTLNAQAQGLNDLDAGINGALGRMTASSASELAAYRTAFADHKAGYIHLQNAQKEADEIQQIDPLFPALKALQADLLKDSEALRAALRTAEAARATGQMEDALQAIEPYRAFAGEEKRIAALFDANFDFHVAQAKQAETAPDWPTAVSEYEKALAAKDSDAVREALKNARAQQVITQDRQAADKAEEASKAYEQEHDLVHAYEALATLTSNQQKLVSADLDRLKPGYIDAAAQLAKSLSQAHTPIRGIADEVAIENAYNYLQDAYELSQNESYHDRMQLLADQMSNYLLDQARRYLAKPAGSGTELGWMYLSEAASYKGSNLDAVRDATTAAASAHALRARLSIRVQFRDQTSQRDSAGFAGQLENALITGLENSRTPTKVVRSGENTPIEADFQITGDVLQHHLSVTPEVEALDSKYRAGEKEVPSEPWNDANRAYEKANIELQTAQASLQGAQAKGNKKQIEEMKRAVEAAQKAVEEAHVKLDATPKTVTTDVLRPYTYTRKTISLSGAIQLQFRIAGSFSSESSAAIPVGAEEHKQVVVLLNVKPEDTEGVKPSGVEPDAADFMTTLENKTLSELLKTVREQVEALPAQIYKQARTHESESDLDGAGEDYLRYLNIAADAGSAESRHARQFLQEQFNMTPAAKTRP
jgi:uncharacterized protein YqgV (UPF0045/DUF77 family)